MWAVGLTDVVCCCLHVLQCNLSASMWFMGGAASFKSCCTGGWKHTVRWPVKQSCHWTVCTHTHLHNYANHAACRNTGKIERWRPLRSLEDFQTGATGVKLWTINELQTFTLVDQHKMQDLFSLIIVKIEQFNHVKIQFAPVSKYDVALRSSSHLFRVLNLATCMSSGSPTWQPERVQGPQPGNLSEFKVPNLGTCVSSGSSTLQPTIISNISILDHSSHFKGSVSVRHTVPWSLCVDAVKHKVEPKAAALYG